MRRKMCIYVYKNQQNRQTGSRNLIGPKILPTIWGTYIKLVTKYQISAINSCWEKCDEKWAYMFNAYKNQQSRQTGSRNLMCPKTLPTIWGTYMKLVTKYHISAINSCWEKCDEKCAYMFNMYKNQLSRQTDGSNNATHNMVYLYDACDQISDFCHQQLLRKMRRKISWTDGRTDRGKTVYPPFPFGERGYKYCF
jgi:hypothetical protein